MGRRKAEAAKPPARSEIALLAAIQGIFVVVLLAAAVAMLNLIRIGWWGSPLEILVGFVLIAAALVGALFLLDGIRRDAQRVGFNPALEARNAWRRWRGRPGGPSSRQQFASQRFTGRSRRR